MHEAHSKLDEGHGRHCRDERNEGVRTGNQKGKKLLNNLINLCIHCHRESEEQYYRDNPILIKQIKINSIGFEND
jgi:hypothetical protein